MSRPASLLDVHALLPHRYPLLLVDAVTELEPGQRVVGIKRVTGNEWCGCGPAGLGAPCAMPHNLVVEALAQLSAAILVGLVEGGEGAIGYFMGINRVRYRGAARPGDVVRLEVELRQFRRGICRTFGVATVEGTQIVRAELTTIVRPAKATGSEGGA
jgi:3-hydroxyacyl-[acyl-carrier-protein] dehydratase